MEDVGWTAVIQTGLLAIFTMIIRKGSQRDADRVVTGTASQTTSDEIRNDVKQLKDDVALLKKVAIEQHPIDHRGPKG